MLSNYFVRSATESLVSHQTVAGAPCRTYNLGNTTKWTGPILIGTAVSVVTYTDFIALVLTRQTFVGRERAQ